MLSWKKEKNYKMDDWMQSQVLTFLLGLKIEDLNFYSPTVFAKQAVSLFIALKWWETGNTARQKTD